MILRMLFPVLAMTLLAGCVSSKEAELQEKINRRMFASIHFETPARLKYTLKHNANPNAKDPRGVPVLIRAAAAGKLEHVKVLLENGADINITDPDGETAMFAAASRGDNKMIALLLEKGASPNGKGRNGRSPAMEAARLGHIETLKFLLDRGADINAVDEDTAGLVAYAATAGKNAIEEIKMLEARGIKIDLKNTELLGSPFLRALYFDREETALYLLSRMEDLNKDSRMKQIGKVAVYYAISHYKKRLLKALVDKKLELDYNEPLSFKLAKMTDIIGIYKLAARNDLIERRYTPLMYACIYGHPDMVEYLVNSGANPTIRSNEGQTAEAYAKDRATLEMIKRKTKEWHSVYLEGKKRQRGLVIEKDESVRRSTIFDF
ncbi:MAG: ankyrin repeat domain-containing protein [Lentisphaeria bacterium]|nr:ankyrin repeat domain-containing protein [Lentisphaeria bacterium]